MDVIRLIASDLDATLLDGQSQLPPDFAETVRALAERGIRFAAASGRPIYTLEEMFAPLRDDIILVGDNGGAICWKGESLYLSEMDAADWGGRFSVAVAGADWVDSTRWQGRPGARATPPSSAGWKRPMWRSSSGHTTGSSRDSTPRWNMSLIWRT